LRRIREIPLPRETLIVLLRRGDRAMVPRGDTRVEPGDVLILLTTRAQEESLRMWIGAL
jgi:trk system potassium uptake protein TrkA